MMLFFIYGYVIVSVLLTILFAVLLYRGARGWRRAGIGPSWVGPFAGWSLFLFWLFVVFWLGGGQKVYWDWRVDRMCAVDGGVTVYETVELPAERFDEWGMVNFYHPARGENALGPEYTFEWDINYYRRGNPQVWKTMYQVSRVIDGKRLGETVLYGRAGGGVPGPWQPSGYRCPPVAIAGPNAMLKEMFVLKE
jgi:hypothetical protein